MSYSKRTERKRKVERKEEAVEDKSIWFQYFHSIKNVCPWSFESYCNGRVKITQFDRDILELNEQNWSLKEWDAIVYITEMSVNELDEFVEERNNDQEKCEYLWSHPHYTKGGGRQTHCPIIIQQDRQFLTELRRR